MRLHIPLVAAAAVLVTQAPPAQAHHCFRAVFDAAAPVTVKGRIVHIDWVNPHARLYVTGSDAGKPQETFVFWTATPNTLLRSGLTRQMLGAGTEVTVRGFRAHDKSCPASAATGAPACLADARDLQLPGQRQFVFVGSAGSEAPVHPEQAGSARVEAIAAGKSPGGWCPTEPKA